ncbi:hypothetical protein DASC09_017340 [Saccharomycopsis crataegensis]|uniref:PA domain-containing protein n=1 Tax=Saccharomycopsis crataegensis TaxID=43959 RepID=A0AAV5QJ04_9ASCO|nr:hypothetical protein DASC09_017340 [Saccharomycopsis crataegensis]
MAHSSFSSAPLCQRVLFLFACVFTFFVSLFLIIRDENYSTSISYSTTSAALSWVPLNSNTTISYPARYSAFSPTIETVTRHNGSLGVHQYRGQTLYVSYDACNPALLKASLEEEPLYNTTSKMFVSDDVIPIVIRGGCQFKDKVINLQDLGAKAVIVGNDMNQPKLIEMRADFQLKDVIIPALFVSQAARLDLHQTIFRSDDIIEITLSTSQNVPLREQKFLFYIMGLILISVSFATGYGIHLVRAELKNSKKIESDVNIELIPDVSYKEQEANVYSNSN